MSNLQNLDDSIGSELIADDEKSIFERINHNKINNLTFKMKSNLNNPIPSSQNFDNNLNNFSNIQNLKNFNSKYNKNEIYYTEKDEEKVRNIFCNNLEKDILSSNIFFQSIKFFLEITNTDTISGKISCEQNFNLNNKLCNYSSFNNTIRNNFNRIPTAYSLGKNVCNSSEMNNSINFSNSLNQADLQEKVIVKSFEFFLLSRKN